MSSRAHSSAHDRQPEASGASESAEFASRYLQRTLHLLCRSPVGAACTYTLLWGSFLPSGLVSYPGGSTEGGWAARYPRFANVRLGGPQGVCATRVSTKGGWMAAGCLRYPAAARSSLRPYRLAASVRTTATDPRASGVRALTTVSTLLVSDA